MKLSNLLTTFVIAIVVLFTGCKKDDFVEVAGVCPLVISTSPINLSTSVPLDQIVTATFNEKMNAATVTPASFSLQGAKKGIQEVTGAFSYNQTNNTISFVPNPELEPGTTYTGTVKAIVKDLNGNALQADYHWSFSTGLLIVPTVISTDPLNLAIDVALNKTVTANFSEAMTGTTLTAASFTLKDGVNPIAGAVSYTGTTASFNPTIDLLHGKLYTATITTAAQNLAGTGLAVDKTWTFTTVVALVAPTVISTDPLNLAIDVALNKTVTASFSEAMTGTTLTAASFTLKDGVNPVAGAVSYAGTTASFNPTVDLLPGKLYTATITTAAQNLAGTGLSVDKTWTFTTVAALAVPTVISTSPLNLAIDEAINTNVTATFSIPMNGASLTTTSFTLLEGVNPVAGSVSYAGTTATFNPTVDLLPGTLYTATITTAATSVDGEPMASANVWAFTTIAASVPSVTSTNPLDLAIDVPENQVITADFSEAMDLLTITTSTFTVMDGATVVAGSVDYAGTTASFTPSSLLLLGKTYTATITTGAQSSGGTAIANDYVWTFSTGAALPLGPGIIDLGTAGNFAIIGKSGISTTGVTSITGDIGVSPVSSTSITGFGLIMDASNEFAVTPIVTGKVYASDYSAPTPAYITQAISDMETALTAGMGMTLSVITELGAGDISGMTLVPGLYKWGTGLNISGVGVTLSGGPDDTWVFQISSDFVVNGDIILSGGAQAKNIFWVTQTQALLASTVDFSGNIIAQTLIDLKTGAKVTGRLLSQTAVTLDAATVVKP